jgi:5-formyltetrahydrofolate cyclo-ligase
MVPGVAFDRRGYRLGHGAGFYDRFLKQVRPDCVRAGLAYDFPVVEALPISAHDVRLNLLFTETCTLEFEDERER